MAQTDRDRLLHWMQEKEFNIETLGAMTGDSYAALHLMLNAKRPIGDKFKWRFARVFGLDEAAKVFEDTPPVSVHTTTVAPS